MINLEAEEVMALVGLIIAGVLLVCLAISGAIDTIKKMLTAGDITKDVARQSNVQNDPIVPK